MTAKDPGPLDYKIAIVDSQGRPSPEFQRRWNTQRDNNALIGTITFGSGVPTGTPANGAEYADTSTTPFTLYIGNAGTWHKVGVTQFVELHDAPGSYTGQGGAIVRVNSGATALEFTNISSLLDAISSTQGTILYRGPTGWSALAPGTSGQVLQTNGAAANPTWATSSGGGGVSPFYTSLSPPNISNYTLTRSTNSAAAGSSLTTTSRGMLLTAKSNGTGDCISYAGRAVSGTAWTYIQFVNITWDGYSANSVGIGVMDSTGKLVAFGPRILSAGSQNWTYMRWNNITTPSYSGETGINNCMPYQGPMWLKMQLTGGQLQFSAGFDGENFTAFNYQSSTAFLTTAPVQVGPYFDNNAQNTIVNGYIHVMSETFTTP